MIQTSDSNLLIDPLIFKNSFLQLHNIIIQLVLMEAYIRRQLINMLLQFVHFHLQLFLQRLHRNQLNILYIYLFLYRVYCLTWVMLQQYWQSTWFCSVANVRSALSSSSCCRSSAMQSSVSRVQSSTTWLCFRILPTSVMRCRRCRISSLSTERIVDMSCSSTWTRWSGNWSKRSMLALGRCIFCWCLPRGHSFRWDRIRMRGMNTLQLFGHSSSTWPQCMRCSYQIANGKKYNLYNRLSITVNTP